MTNIVKIKEEINTQLADKQTMQSLLDTTFKGLEAQLMKRAILEGMMRGFKFENFLQKDVYAIPFKGTYSLITSIDYARKMGMRSGVVGKSKPEFEMDGDKIVSCTITVQRKIDGHIGDYSATAFFTEYYKAGYNGRPSLWDTKPRTMIAKVAEMHALRMACPEELSQVYTEEDMEQEVASEMVADDIQEKVDAIKTVEELKTYYQANKGLGKAFDKAVMQKKNELQNA